MPTGAVANEASGASLWAELERDLAQSRTAGLYRRPALLNSPNARAVRIGGRTFLNFSSNNYLGLAEHPGVARKAAEAAHKWGGGSGASRLISGGLDVHAKLERSLAAFKGEEDALVFTSGYLANLGAVSTLCGGEDVVLVDRLNHASLIDAARLSGAKLWVYPHLDLYTLNGLLLRASSFRRRLVLTDAYFSMDGHVAPLDRLLELCRAHRAALLVDEAHSTGVFGKKGAGLTEQFGLAGKIDVVMGTLSKSLGSVGGYIAGRKTLRDYLVNKSRTFIYTTGPAPAASAAALESLSLIRKDPALRQRLWKNTARLREGLLALGLNLMGSEGPIVPVLIGETRRALRVKEVLDREGVFAPVVRPPTVPKGTDRLRLSVTASHKPEDVAGLLTAMKKARKALA